MNELKDRVLKRRRMLDLTQQKLAKKVGVKQQSIQQLEDGLVKRPRYLLELSKALECDANWLLTGEEPKKFDLFEEVTKAIAKSIGVRMRDTYLIARLPSGSRLRRLPFSAGL